MAHEDCVPCNFAVFFTVSTLRLQNMYPLFTALAAVCRILRRICQPRFQHSRVSIERADRDAAPRLRRTTRGGGGARDARGGARRPRTGAPPHAPGAERRAPRAGRRLELLFAKARVGQRDARAGAAALHQHAHRRSHRARQPHAGAHAREPIAGKGCVLCVRTNCRKGRCAMRENQSQEGRCAMRENQSQEREVCYA
eukprot:820494-Prorocentrum_minimum.AAC.2